MSMKDSLKELRELTDRMPPYNPYFYDEDRVMCLETKSGGARSVGVYKDINISIAKTTFEQETVLDYHSHPEIETVQVLEGEIVMVLKEHKKVTEVTLRQHSVLTIPPNTLHYCYNVKRTVIIVSLMPYSPNFPLPE
jgi:quercetin dioxygenase-like cupin family protein